MIELLLAGAGLAALTVGALLIRRAGTGYRVGRLLAAAPDASLDDVIELARSGTRRYVRAHGRIASDEDFPDDQQRPLVYRRTRLERRGGDGAWSTLADERLAVPFGLEDRQSFVGIDVDALGSGLVVVSREATGLAGELPAGTLAAGTLPAGADLDPATPIRLRIEQVSAVEHASAAGVPGLDRSGAAILTAGLGRPLILTTLDQAAAMRLLAVGRRGSLMVGAGLLVAGMASVALAAAWWVLGL